MSANPLARPEQVAEWLQISPEKLSRLRKTGQGPKYIKLGREVRYAWADVHSWCLEHRTERPARDA